MQNDVKVTPAFLPALLLWSAKRDRAIIGRTPSAQTGGLLSMYQWARSVHHGQLYEATLYRAVIERAMAEIDAIVEQQEHNPAKTVEERRRVADSLVQLGELVEQAQEQLAELEYAVDRRLYA